MRRLACVMFVGALVLSGCGGEDPPPPAPTSVATTPANPGVTLPAMPERADEFSPTGANRFVRHYVSVIDYASKTGDVRELTRISDPDCKGCQRYIDLFVNLYKDGGNAEGRDWNISDIELRYQRIEGVESLATTDLSISAGRIQPSQDDRATEYPATVDQVTFGLRYEGGWTITQFAFGGVK